MEPKILFEDDSLLVVNKPSGWVVNNAETTGQTPTVQNWIKKKRAVANPKLDVESEFIKRSGIVHRLDKETSGVLVIAKIPLAFEKLQEQFKKREVDKTYLALVHGVPKEATGTISAEVARLPWRRTRFGVVAGGRRALTLFKVVKLFERDGEKLALLSLSPKTGRTHQIRVHLKSIGLPVVSDTFYAGRKTSRNDRTWCRRLFLHASKIEFSHPVDGQKTSVASGLPPDLSEVLYRLDVDNLN